MNNQINTPLTLEALDIAVRYCKPPKGLIFHSGQGVQYATVAFRERMESYGTQQSILYDNAVAENFFSCLKCELIQLKQYPTWASAQVGYSLIWRPSTMRHSPTFRPGLAVFCAV